MIEVSELRNQSVGELAKRARAIKDELFQARFKHATQQLQQPAQLKELRRDIARIKMVMTEKATKQAAAPSKKKAGK